MALRLAGEEFSVVEGLDALGNLRIVDVSDGDPGVKVNQKGTGRIFDFQDGGASVLYMDDGAALSLDRDLSFVGAHSILTTTGNLTLSPAGAVALGGKSLIGAGDSGSTWDSIGITVYKASSGSVAELLNLRNGGTTNNSGAELQFTIGSVSSGAIQTVRPTGGQSNNIQMSFQLAVGGVAQATIWYFDSSSGSLRSSGAGRNLQFANAASIITDAGDLSLSPAGDVKFGTHSAIGAETVSGYVMIKDAGGTTRKLAVVS